MDALIFIVPTSVVVQYVVGETFFRNRVLESFWKMIFIKYWGCEN